MRQENKDKARTRWTWWLALLGGNVCGLASDADALVRVVSHHPYRQGQISGLEATTLLTGSVLLPAVVTGIAPRKPFLWGAVPLGLMFVWSLADRIVVYNGPGLDSDFRGNGIAALVFLLLVCGPISFIRLQMRLARDKQARRLAEYQAWREGSAQAGVWPPPVRADGYQESRGSGRDTSRGT